jgi:hypothetical protein
MSEVTIYRFRGYDITRGQSIVSPRWGTLEARLRLAMFHAQPVQHVR